MPYIVVGSLTSSDAERKEGEGFREKDVKILKKKKMKR